ncbi:zf-HC2 domain-containing protein [Streptomyces thermodiastaticus]|uniref:zf-HC2 domain-containing protein n=1 Tax=Streptomyces thermodiastaticus TaxID=44061 RepID=UPI00167309CE|nr:zf-HC2 domain-containing protein [Streptomyces thermodiastaticus]MCE7549940.1 zf-HC2 domain-containing protein [Streptomyces thermodiastaticus]GHF65013.1 membrane protein [Streptomyces thermodiastaticus]
MSGSRSEPAARRLAEQHLGDRLSALVDGELGPDARERVLAHVATCPKCKAEVDAQRRLKSVFAQAAPPPPSESLLARLNGLAWGGDPGSGGVPLGGGGLRSPFPGPSGRPGDDGVFGGGRGERFAFGFLPARPHPSEPEPEPSAGFRVHPVGRPDAERSASRGLRIAFVAAGAVSLAAIALGGVTSGTAVEARGGSGSGSNVTPASPAGTAPATTQETARRRQPDAASTAQGRPSVPGARTTAPTTLSAPLLPGIPQSAAERSQEAIRPLAAPSLPSGAGALSPQIRPLLMRPPFGLAAWSADPRLTAPGLLAAPQLPTSAAPSPTASPGSTATR